jgi:PAS domain S-box-containing protein
MKTTRPINILAVDDNPNNLLSVEAVLHPLDHALIKASSGSEALPHLQNHDFAVIILDVQMPGMDGYQTAARIRETDRSRHTPIIFLTAIDPRDPANAARGYELGAVDYLFKPFDPVALKAKVSAFVELWRVNQELKEEVARRKEAEKAVLQLNEDLEQRVRDRTAALEREAADRAQAEKALRESEALYRSLGEAVPDFVWSCNADGSAHYVNKRWMDYTGLTVETAGDIPQNVMHHPDDYPELKRRWTEAALNRTSYEAEFRFRRHDGVYRWYMARAVPVKDEQGNVIKWVGTTTDIHERKEAEEALRQSEERFRLIVENARDYAIYTLDAQGCVTSWSPGAEQILGYSETEAVGMPYSQMFTEEDRAGERPRDVMMTALQEGRSVSERWHLRRDGSRFWASGFLNAVRDEKGSLKGFVKIVRDVTEQKESEEKLAAHQAHVEALNQRLQRAMTETHHRVKNSLQIVSAMVDMRLMDYEDTVPRDEVKRLGSYIGTLASVHSVLTQEAKQNAGEESARFLSTKAVLEELMPMLQQCVGNKRLESKIADLRLPARQGTTLAIITNELVNNAVKHAGETVAVELQVTGEDAVLIVSDDGPGFPEEFRPEQAANTGIELIESLAQWDLGGKIRYENRPQEEGPGGRVVVAFPVPRITEEALPSD